MIWLRWMMLIRSWRQLSAQRVLPTLAAIRASKSILLANKESLVTCGRLFMDDVKRHKAQLCR